MAESVKKGFESAGGSATIYQWVHAYQYHAISYPSSPCLLVQRISETLPKELLEKLHAPAKPNYPFLAPGDLTKFDAFIFGIPTRYGNFAVQWKDFWDASGTLWASGALFGKYASVFVSTVGAARSRPSSRRSRHSLTTASSSFPLAMPRHLNNSRTSQRSMAVSPPLSSTPLGVPAMHDPSLLSFDMLRCKTYAIPTGSPWGAGTFAGPDSSRNSTALELNIADIQGRHFWETVRTVKF